MLLGYIGFFFIVATAVFFATIAIFGYNATTALFAAGMCGALASISLALLVRRDYRKKMQS